MAAANRSSERTPLSVAEQERRLAEVYTLLLSLRTPPEHASVATAIAEDVKGDVGNDASTATTTDHRQSNDDTE